MRAKTVYLNWWTHLFGCFQFVASALFFHFFLMLHWKNQIICPIEYPTSLDFADYIPMVSCSVFHHSLHCLSVGSCPRGLIRFYFLATLLYEWCCSSHQDIYISISIYIYIYNLNEFCVLKKRTRIIYNVTVNQRKLVVLLLYQTNQIEGWKLLLRKK